MAQTRGGNRWHVPFPIAIHLLMSFTHFVENLRGNEDTPNSRSQIPFENASFVGNVIFLVPTKPIDQFYRNFFENNQRVSSRFVFQIRVDYTSDEQGLSE